MTEQTMEKSTAKPRASRARSPQYPAVGLKEAVDKIEVIYKEEKSASTSRNVIASHMGYKSLNGKSLTLLATLKKYGLLEGRGNQVSVSARAIAIIAYPTGTPERSAAIQEAANMPDLFRQLDERFNNGEASDASIRAYLMTHGFVPQAAETVVQSYRETKDFVRSEVAGGQSDDDEKNYHSATEVDETSELASATITAPASDGVAQSPAQNDEALPSSGMRQMVYALDEGDVTIAFPEKMSPASVEDLKDYLAIFVKKIERQAEESANKREVE